MTNSHMDVIDFFATMFSQQEPPAYVFPDPVLNWGEFPPTPYINPWPDWPEPPYIAVPVELEWGLAYGLS